MWPILFYLSNSFHMYHFAAAIHALRSLHQQHKLLHWQSSLSSMLAIFPLVKVNKIVCLFWKEQEGKLDFRGKEHFFFLVKEQISFWPKQTISDMKEDAYCFS